MIYFDISIIDKARVNTGIQRVAKEILKRFIVKNEIVFKIISYNEIEHIYKAIDNESFLDFLVCKYQKEYKFKYLEEINIKDFKKNDIFFDIDAYWNSLLKRSYLYKILYEKEIKIYNIVHDLIPIKFPKYAFENTLRNFIINLAATYKYSYLTIFPSRSTEKDYLEIAKQIGVTNKLNTIVIKWGSEITKNISDEKHFLLNEKYILFVGTLEPRKNQYLLVKVFEELSLKYKDIKLVLIGKEGWNNEKFISYLKNHELLNDKIFWLNNVNDSLLIKFYNNAYINVYLSEYEGFGLPIAESLNFNNITITSRNSSMYEVGKNFADYIKYNSFNELYEILNLYLEDSELYNSKKQYIKQNYKPYNWDMTYQFILNSLRKKGNLNVIKNDKLQFVFISIDKNNLIGTIKEIDKNISFVKEYIIVTKKEFIKDFKTIKSKNKISIINENNILGKYAENFEKRDHVSKNWILRCSLLNIDFLDDEFIMLDDDNRPLKKINIEHFIKDNKYNAYYFYDLLEWNCFNTDYDIGQHNMKKILDNEGYELLSYSSHKPQIINKKIFKEMVDKYFQIGLKLPIDEWSMYFNYAISTYPFLFNKIKYDTLNWPSHPSNWIQMYIPNKYEFENFYNTNFQGTYDEKIKQKQKELLLYLENQKLDEKNSFYYKKYNMVHGSLVYKKDNKKIILCNIPYFLYAKKGTWKKISINYKALNLANQDVRIGYYINENMGAFTNLKINDNFIDDISEFNVSCGSLQEEIYNILIDVFIDNKPVYGLNSKYLIKLIVEK